MKSIVYIILGIILGITTIRLAFSAVVLIASLQLISAAICGFLAYVAGILCGKCFNKI